MNRKHLLSTDDLSREKIKELLTLSDEIIKSPESFSNLCSDKLMATLFFEPSTRTRLSFEAAMSRLGGKILGFSDAGVSSTTKGETLADTIRTVSSYVDLIVMRHPKEGAATLAGEYSEVPVINAGDGGHQHPTQTLTDLLTISQCRGSLENMTVGVCGDLKFGRTVHSLVHMLSEFPDNKYFFIAPDELKIPEYIKNMLDAKGIEYLEVTDLESVIDKLDMLYMTRVQKERFFNEDDYMRLKDCYILDEQKMSLAKDDLIVLHPLPRVNEIAVEVDKDKRAVYFKQVHYGMIVRMALILKTLGVK